MKMVLPVEFRSTILFIGLLLGGVVYSLGEQPVTRLDAGGAFERVDSAPGPYYGVGRDLSGHVGRDIAGLPPKQEVISDASKVLKVDSLGVSGFEGPGASLLLDDSGDQYCGVDCNVSYIELDRFGVTGVGTSRPDLHVRELVISRYETRTDDGRQVFGGTSILVVDDPQ